VNLVVFSPLPPMRTGIADYSHECLTGLALVRRCTVVTEDGVDGLRAPDGVAVIPVSEYRRRQAEFAGTLHLYHLGNNPDHVYMLPILVARPGLVVLHDLSLHHLLDCATAAVGDIDGYADAIAAEYGAPGRVLAEQFRAYRLRERSMTQDMPMLGGLLGPSLGVIVHSQFAAARVWARVPEAAISIVPHHHIPPGAAPRSRASVREELGIGADEVMFLSLGFVTHTKCIDRALLALAGTAGGLPPFRYVVAGETRAGEPDVREMANRLGLGIHVLTLGFQSEESFYDLIAAADVVINLRHPIGGETSGTLIRALGSGACTVVVDRGPFAEIPDGAAEKIAWGENFNRRLGTALLRLAHEPERRARIGAAAGEYIRAEHGLDRTTPLYLRAIEAAEARQPAAWRSPAQWAFAPPSAPRLPVGPLWQISGALPLPVPGLRAIRLGSDGPASHGWDWETRTLEIEAGAATDDPADLALVEVDAAILAAGAFAQLRRLNAMLRFGGVLVLNLTRTVDGPRGALERAAEGARLLEACGFTVQEHVTGPEPDLAGLLKPAPLKEEHCWRAVKSGGFLARQDWATDWVVPIGAASGRIAARPGHA